MDKIPKEEIERIEKKEGFARRLKILMTIKSLNLSRKATIFSVTGEDIEKVTGYSMEIVWYELLQLKNEGFVEAIYPTEGETIQHCSLEEKGKVFLKQYLRSIKDCKNAKY